MEALHLREPVYLISVSTELGVYQETYLSNNVRKFLKWCVRQVAGKILAVYREEVHEYHHIINFIPSQYSTGCPY